MRLLAVTAVAAERDAVLAGLGEHREVTLWPYDARAVAVPEGELLCVAGGVGVAAAATATATALALAAYDAVLSVGIAGGFGSVSAGQVLVADDVVAADLGALTDDGFIGVDTMGFGTTRHACDPVLVRAASQRLPGSVVGTLLTLTTMTGTDDRAAELAARYTRAVGEAMEGWGVAEAAARFGVPFLELRTVSNKVGRRDRAAWDIPAALTALSSTIAQLFEEPLP